MRVPRTRQSRRGDEGRRLRIGCAFRAAPRPEYEEADDQWRDIVEQQGRDRLVDQLGRPQQRRRQRPERAAQEAQRGHQRQQSQAGRSAKPSAPAVASQPPM